jgi:hypothetical protein
MSFPLAIISAHGYQNPGFPGSAISWARIRETGDHFIEKGYQFLLSAFIKKPSIRM